MLHSKQPDAAAADGLRSARSSVVRRASAQTADAIPPPRRKRAIPDDDAEDETQESVERRKKSRGRPRLDPTDETPEDRRRTQIRLAQRAYRHRKDTAITTLEEKVKGLEKTNTDMSKEFSSFYELAVAQGILDASPELAIRLRGITDKFLSSARSPVEDEDDPGSGSRSSEIGDNERFGDAGLRMASHSSHSPEHGRIGPDHRAQTTPGMNVSGFNVASSLTPSASALLQPPNSLPYEVITQPTPENASFPMYLPMDNQPFGNFFQPTPQPTIYSSLPAPQSYAYQEPTFGKRLQRSAAEAGLRLASMQSPPPGRYAAVFGFTLLFETRESVVRRLSGSLARSRDESMNMWTTPFTNLGGSGLFFDEHSSGGQGRLQGAALGGQPYGNEGMREVRKPREVTGFSIGPFDARVEDTRDLVDGRLRMKYGGFEGDFFDSEEVEIYLRKRGIFIPPQSDFVSVEIDTSQLADSSAEGLDGGLGTATEVVFSKGPPQNPGTSVSGGGWSPNAGTGTQSGFEPALPMFAAAGGPGVPQLDAGMVQFMCPSIPQQAPANAAIQDPKVKATLDVQTLINEIIGKSVCVGRTSAVRPADIDRAIKVASGLVFATLHKPA